MAAALLPNAIAENRAGRLTNAQRASIRALSRGWRKAELQFAGIFGVIGVLVLISDGSRDAAIKPLIGLGFLVLAGALVAISIIGADPPTRDARAGRVLSTEGAIRKWTETTHGGSSSTTSHYAEAGNVRVEMGPQSYEALPEAGIVRLFYLPSSRRLVNFEQLADRPLPEGALTDPRFALKAAVGTILGSADARAELAAMEHGIQAEVHTSLAPPPADERRLSAEALPGTWSNPMMTVTFGADGSVAATLPGGLKRQGHWSVDGSGRLETDLLGQAGSIDAWIKDADLTVEIDGQGVVLHRR